VLSSFAIIELSDKHELLLCTLCHQVRVLTSQQVNRLVSGIDAGRELSSLEQARLIEIEPRIIHPELVLDKPVVKWQPGEEAPDFLPIASELRRRWKKSPVETEIVVPTKKALRLCGGYNVKPRASEWRHDVTMSGLYLKYLDEHQEQAERWMSGDELRASRRWYFGDRVPDAVIVCSDGEQVEQIVEFGGSYNRQKLEAMHEEFQIAPYEIW